MSSAGPLFTLYQAIQAKVQIDDVRTLGDDAWVYSTGELSGRLRGLGTWMPILSWQDEPEVAGDRPDLSGGRGIRSREVRVRDAAAKRLVGPLVEAAGNPVALRWEDPFTENPRLVRSCAMKRWGEEAGCGNRGNARQSAIASSPRGGSRAPNGRKTS